MLSTRSQNESKCPNFMLSCSFNGQAGENIQCQVIWFSFVVGSLLMSAPSSVETSTSTGSGDWLNREGAGLVDQPLPLLPASILPLRSHTDDPPALSEPLRRVLRRWGLGRPPKTGWTVRDHQSPKLLRRDGGATLFFFFSSVFFLLDSLFVFFFFFPKQNGASLPYRSWYWLCAYEDELVYMSQSMLAEFVSPFLNFFDNWEGGGERGGSAKQQRQFCVIISSSSSSPSPPDIALKQTTHQFTVLTPRSNWVGENREPPLFRSTSYPDSDSLISADAFLFPPNKNGSV